MKLLTDNLINEKNSFDKHYILIKDMENNDYYPKFLVEKIKTLLFVRLIDVLENGETNTEEIQRKLDILTQEINDLEEEFGENNSEIETVARESITETVKYILNWFNIDIDIETAIRKRTW